MPNSNQSETLWTIAKLASELELDYQGDADQPVNSVATFSRASETDICFLRTANYYNQLLKSRCGAAIVPQNFSQPVPSKALLFSTNPHYAFIQVINLLQIYQGNSRKVGVHPSATVSTSAILGDNVSIAANCVIGERVKLGNNVTIGSGSIIEDDVIIGDNSILYANVTLCFAVSLGKEVILQPGVVIGSDGFGLVYHADIWQKVPHLGSVLIGDRVEIGANTTIDRGALDDTVIEQGVKIDNQIQIGHNVKIGENTAIAACVGIAGSTVIGKNCKISGAVGIVGHLTITDNVTITVMSVVTQDILKSGTYSSGTPLQENRLWHRNNVRYKSLDKLAKKVARLKD